MKKLLIVVLLIIAVPMVANSFSRLASPKFVSRRGFLSITGEKPVMRNDVKGNGWFGAKRGARLHRGYDIVITKGQKIYAPFDCTYKRMFNVYEGNTKYKGIEIVGKGEFSEFTAKLMYVSPTLFKGDNCKAGEQIGIGQAISQKTGNNGMINHVHFELYKNGILVNPSLYII